MKPVILFFIFLLLTSIFPVYGQQDYALVIHGGAGVMLRESLSTEHQNEYIEKLEEALELGKKLLQKGSTSVEVVVEVIKVLEDSPLFNAGKGAVFTHSGVIELDASIMEGKSLNAGAIAGVKDIKNPISAAKAVMEKSEHVFLSGAGASEFAREQGLEMVKNKYFQTSARYESLMRLKRNERKRTSSDNTGTVGCVALDKYGNLCAGTSTGGMTNKRYGRIGDSPVIGAGTYADNSSCAVSCTGHGEYFIRLGIAHDIASLVEYKGLSVQEASHEALRKLDELGGTGGVIALDVDGNIAMDFNTDAMFRGFINSNGEKEISIFKNE